MEFLRYLAQDVRNAMTLRSVLYHLGNGVHWNLQRMDDQAVLHTLAGQLPGEGIIVIDPALGERQDTALVNHLSHCALLPNQCSPDAAIRRLGELRAAPEPGVFSNLRDIYNNRDLPRVEKIHRGMQALFAPSYYQAKREKVPFDAAATAKGMAGEAGNAAIGVAELLINGVLSGLWPFGTGPHQVDLDRIEIEDSERYGAGLVEGLTLVGAAGALRGTAKQGAQQSKKSIDSTVDQEKSVAQNGNTVPTGSVVPDKIASSQLGPKLGSGGDKVVFEFGDNKVVGILKPGKNPAKIDEELRVLGQLDELGLPTVNAQKIFVDENPAILMDRFAKGSKTIVAKNPRRPGILNGADTSLLNGRSIADLQAIRSTLIEKQVKVNDLQFLIGKDGRVVIADPLGVSPGTPSPTNRLIINKMIEAASRGNK